MTLTMTLKEAMKKAVETKDVKLFSRTIDQMRDMGMGYNSCAAAYLKHTGLDLDGFESFSEEADYADSRE